MNAEWQPDTLAAQLGHYIDPVTGGVIPPFQPSTTYARDAHYQLIQPQTEYSRDDNPTYPLAESLIAELEGGEDALLFASGMAGIASLFQTLDQGDRVAAPTRMYFGTVKWLTHFAQKRQIEINWFDPAIPGSLEAAIQPNIKLVWVENPANPTWDIIDIKAAAEAAHDVGAPLAVDSTVASPVLSQPLKLGADIVFHSATKYLNGHSDVMGGVLVSKEKNNRWEKIRFERHHAGAIMGTFETWLLLRGMRTMFVRVKHSSASAMAIARHFEKHPKLERVLYPGLASHPGHEVASRQMQDGFGGMLSILVKGDFQMAVEVAKRFKVFIPATSLGGVESLVEHRKTVEGPDSPTPDHLLRLSVGLENLDDLIADLEQSLQVV